MHTDKGKYNAEAITSLQFILSDIDFTRALCKEENLLSHLFAMKQIVGDINDQNLLNIIDIIITFLNNNAHDLQQMHHKIRLDNLLKHLQQAVTQSAYSHSQIK